MITKKVGELFKDTEVLVAETNGWTDGVEVLKPAVGVGDADGIEGF